MSKPAQISPFRVALSFLGLAMGCILCAIMAVVTSIDSRYFQELPEVGVAREYKVHRKFFESKAHWLELHSTDGKGDALKLRISYEYAQVVEEGEEIEVLQHPDYGNAVAAREDFESQSFDVGSLVFFGSVSVLFVLVGFFNFFLYLRRKRSNAGRCSRRTLMVQCAGIAVLISSRSPRWAGACRVLLPLEERENTFLFSCLVSWFVGLLGAGSA